MEKTIESSKKFINDYDFKSLKDLFNEIVNFFINFDILSQTLIFNIICSSLLLSLLSSFFIAKFSNYIINKFNITEKYPKLYKFLIIRKI